MYVKFKNLSSATRIMYDVSNVERKFPPGFEAEMDMPIRMVKAFEIEADVKKTVAIERLESDEEHTDRVGDIKPPAEPTKALFTLLPEEGQPAEAQTLKEALGRGVTARPPAAEAEVVEVHPDLAKSKDPIAHNAEVAAKAAAAEAETGSTETVTLVEQEPTTATALLAAIEAGTLGAEDQVRIANTVLERRLPKGIKPAGIIKMLRAKASTEV